MKCRSPDAVERQASSVRKGCVRLRQVAVQLEEAHSNFMDGTNFDLEVPLQVRSHLIAVTVVFFAPAAAPCTPVCERPAEAIAAGQSQIGIS